MVRDWSRAQALGYYTIRPSGFNTRMPLHINDDDLCLTAPEVSIRGHITDRSRSEFTMLSYTIHALQVANFARQAVELRVPLSEIQKRQERDESVELWRSLNKQYETFVAGLPSYFRLGSTVGLMSAGHMAAIPVQRWMLHQQLWSIFLRVQLAKLLDEDGRTSCQLLAQNIISTQVQIQARCTVCTSLSTSETQLFNAAVVLLIDVLFSSEKCTDPSSAQLNRLMSRDKVREALDLLRTQGDVDCRPSTRGLLSEPARTSRQRSITAVEALMKLEEDYFSNNEDNSGVSLPGSTLQGQAVDAESSARILTKRRIMDILGALREKDRIAAAASESADFHSSSAFEMPRHSPATAHGVQDVDVLPMLSNDPSYDLWQYLGYEAFHSYPTEEAPFTAYSQNHFNLFADRPS